MEASPKSYPGFPDPSLKLTEKFTWRMRKVFKGECRLLWGGKMFHMLAMKLQVRKPWKSP